MTSADPAQLNYPDDQDYYPADGQYQHEEVEGEDEDEMDDDGSDV